MVIGKKPNWYLALGLPAIVFVTCIFISFTSVFKTNHTALSNAMLLDLVITAPLLYFITIRKSRISKLTVSRVFVVGIFIAGFLLKDEPASLFHFVKKAILPLVELGLIVFIVRKFYIARRQAKRSGDRQVDFLFNCRSILAEFFGSEKIGNMAGSEIAVIYYAFFSKNAKDVDDRNQFSSWKKNGILLVLYTFLCLFIIETTGMHFVFRLWSNTAAWILTGLSDYTCIQLFAHIRAVKARPVQIKRNAVEIHNGLAGDAIIEFSNIEKIELDKKIPGGRNSIKIALISGFENHNCIIYLKQPIIATKIFGIKKSADVILFYIDQPGLFISSINERMNKE